MVKSGEGVKRTYDSPLRRGQARATHRSIVRAAARLFSEHGYVATSIDAIAEEAGVSRATVFASGGGKASLLKEAYDTAIVGDDQEIPLVERPRSRDIRALPTARVYLGAYAHLVSDIGERLAAIHEAMRGAKDADEEVRRNWDEQNGHRRRGCDTVISDVLARGRLRDGLDATSGADIVWVLNDPGLYRQLVLMCGWPKERFAAWLADTMCRLMLPDHEV